MPDDAYAAALESHGLEDLQPLYRALLRRLKSEDPGAYEEAVERYRTDVDDAVAGAGDPVAVWLAYGAWLAPKLAPGSFTRVHANGRAERIEPPLAPGDMIFLLPTDPKRRGFVLAMPKVASPAQRETAALLCE